MDIALCTLLSKKGFFSREICPFLLQMWPHIRVHDLTPEYRLDFSPHWASQPDVLVQCTTHTTAHNPNQRDW